MGTVFQGDKTPLMLAAVEGRKEITKLLLQENGASIHEADDVSKYACTVYISHLYEYH